MCTMPACAHVRGACLFVWACMHVCMCACVHVHVCMRACVHACMCASLHVCMYACVRSFLYAICMRSAGVCAQECSCTVRQAVQLACHPARPKPSQANRSNGNPTTHICVHVFLLMFAHASHVVVRVCVRACVRRVLCTECIVCLCMCMRACAHVHACVAM